MGRIRTETVGIGQAEHFGVYATDDGFVEVVVSKDGIKHIASFTPEEWARVAVGGIELGVIARASKEQSKNKVVVPAFAIPPEIAATLAKNH